jgi:23S rRNA pseudouridine1911/1915/1917 synthase
VDVAGETCIDEAREVDPEIVLAFDPNRPRPETINRRLRVLYEDPHILIVDKPAGVLTQPTSLREPDTLLERASRYLSRKRGMTRPYVGIVHRLDRETSGVILLVCSPAALRPFQTLFRTREIARWYVAIVEGWVEPQKGVIDFPLIPDRGDGRRGISRTPDQGTPSTTHYQVDEPLGRFATKLVCRLETGRTHQIRIHLAELGYPVVGDRVYRDRARPPFPVPFARQALHAQSLGFINPLTGERIDVQAPLPEDLTALIDNLRGR